MSERLKDEQPLADVLQSLIKNSPNLTTLLQLGQRIATPFNTKLTGSDPKEDFKGEVYPSYFKTKGVEYGTALERPCAINQRMRLTFETDARDDYFTRSAERGSFDLNWIGKDGRECQATSVGPTLKNGIAIVMLDLPDNAVVGDKTEFIARVSDTFKAFENTIVVTVKPEAKKSPGGGGRRHPPSSNEGPQRECPSEVAPPMIKRVYRNQWEAEGFDEFTAMKVEFISYSDDERAEFYEFKVNMDNTPLTNESKQKRLDNSQHKLLSEQFLYANVLIGLSLLLDKKRNGLQIEREGEVPQETVEDRIGRTCRALAPFLPALISLGSGDLEVDDQIEGLEETG